VNDAYIEPISFTVPRRAETFQSDIYPPALGARPAVSAQEWLSGKSGLPPKIDFESIYEGNAPVEVAADYKPPAAALAPTPVSKPAPRKEPEPAPAVVRSPPPTMKDQKQSIATLASKYEDDEEDEDDDDGSSFEEVSKPTPRSSFPVRSEPKAPSPTKTTSAPPPKAASPIKSPTYASTPKAATPTPAAPSSSSGALEMTLEQIRHHLETQTKLITSQGAQITHLTSEVDNLKKRVGSGSGSQDQSERIRQLELELESLRS
jgi:coronin-1B/1C/6